MDDSDDEEIDEFIATGNLGTVNIITQNTATIQCHIILIQWSVIFYSQVTA